MGSCMRSFLMADGSTPPLSQYRSTSGLLGAVFALFITLVLYTALVAADTTEPAAHLLQNIDAPAAPALTSNVTTLFVQGGLAAPVGSLVDVPLALDTAGAHVAGLSFSLDYDANCLALDPADGDRNGLPDAIVIDAPAQFRASASVNPGGRQGRLDVMLIDYIPPLAALRDTPALITIQFRVICPLAPGLIDYAYVRFASTPAVGFSDNEGRDLPGVAREGVVQIIGAIPSETPTPTATLFIPFGSPTPTLIATAPSTPIPPPLVLIETLVAPQRITRSDRSMIFIVDYVVLTTMSNVTLSIRVPEHTYFDMTASTLGWQCGTEIVNRQCQFPLYETNRQTSMSGRLFFAVTLNWPLPAQVTQIEFTSLIQVNGVPSNQIQHLILPVLTMDAPQSGALTLDLQTNTAELVTELDHELAYTLTYTNSSQTVLQAVTFHLVLPPAATIRPAPDTSFDWACWLVATGQPECTFEVSELEPGAKGQAQFILNLAPPTRRNAVSAVVVVVYASQEGRVVSSNSAVVPIRQPLATDPDRRRLLLPLIINEPTGVGP